MSEKTFERFVGKYCKILFTEPGKKKAIVIIGLLKNIEHKNGFLIIESKNGLVKSDVLSGINAGASR